MTDKNFRDRSKWPVEGGESFLADWEGAGGSQMQQGGEAAPQADGQKIEVTGGTEVAVEIPIVHVKPQGNGQLGQADTSWDNWVPNEDLSP